MLISSFSEPSYMIQFKHKNFIYLLIYLFTYKATEISN